MKSIAEIPFPYRNIFSKYKNFNEIQSNVFNDVFHTNKSVVVSAPTGSGKTVIFELAIIRLLLLSQNVNDHINNDFKIVYVAPTKALCSERQLDWCQKFNQFGLQCLEVTGDSDITDFSELSSAKLIITTPEKWDSLTRKWKDNEDIVISVKLFMIDEVHLLNEDVRGPILEAIVSRMKTIQFSVKIFGHCEMNLRFITVSATIPNIEDLAEWIGKTNPEIISYFQFAEEKRPVKLERHVIGFNTNLPSFKFDMSLNYKLLPIIRKFSNGKPTLIFCSSRKSVEMASAVLQKESCIMPLSDSHKTSLYSLSKRIKDSKLLPLLLKGIAYHHAGLTYEDRNAIEDGFRNGLLLVLVSTNTLAMGVNLPAHLVIIKSTEFFANGQAIQYTESAILQMIGRAGRPQYDLTGVAVIMTQQKNVTKYENLMNGCTPIESHLHKHLAEHLNSEIVLQTITTLDIAMEWIRSTFLYIRACKSPKTYGFNAPGMTKDKIEKKLEEMCLIQINCLETNGLITKEQTYGLSIRATSFGRLMARYYISFDTIKLFRKIGGNESFLDTFNIIVRSKEFSEFTLRVNDKKLLNELNNKPIRFPIKGRIKTNENKVSCLIQANFGNLHISDPSMIQDSLKMIRIGERITKCFYEFIRLSDNRLSNENGVFKILLHSIILIKCFKAKLWENSEFITKQLNKIGNVYSKALVDSGKTTVKDILETDPQTLELILNKPPPFGTEIHDAISKFPVYQLKFNYEKTLNTLKVFVTQTNPKFRYDKSNCYLLIGDSDNNLLLFNDKIARTVEEENQFYRIISLSNTKIESITAHLIHGNLVGVDESKKLILNPVEEKEPKSSKESKKVSKRKIQTKLCPVKIKKTRNEEIFQEPVRISSPVELLEDEDLFINFSTQTNISSKSNFRTLIKPKGPELLPDISFKSNQLRNEQKPPPNYKKLIKEFEFKKKPTLIHHKSNEKNHNSLKKSTGQNFSDSGILENSAELIKIFDEDFNESENNCQIPDDELMNLEYDLESIEIDEYTNISNDIIWNKVENTASQFEVKNNSKKNNETHNYSTIDLTSEFSCEIQRKNRKESHSVFEIDEFKDIPIEIWNKLDTLSQFEETNILRKTNEMRNLNRKHKLSEVPSLLRHDNQFCHQSQKCKNYLNKMDLEARYCEDIVPTQSKMGKGGKNSNLDRINTNEINWKPIPLKKNSPIGPIDLSKSSFLNFSYYTETNERQKIKNNSDDIIDLCIKTSRALNNQLNSESNNSKNKFTGIQDLSLNKFKYRFSELENKKDLLSECKYKRNANDSTATTKNLSKQFNSINNDSFKPIPLVNKSISYSSKENDVSLIKSGIGNIFEENCFQSSVFGTNRFDTLKKSSRSNHFSDTNNSYILNSQRSNKNLLDLSKSSVPNSITDNAVVNNVLNFNYRDFNNSNLLSNKLKTSDNFSLLNRCSLSARTETEISGNEISSVDYKPAKKKILLEDFNKLSKYWNFNQNNISKAKKDIFHCDSENLESISKKHVYSNGCSPSARTKTEISRNEISSVDYKPAKKKILLEDFNKRSKYWNFNQNNISKEKKDIFHCDSENLESICKKHDYSNFPMKNVKTSENKAPPVVKRLGLSKKKSYNIAKPRNIFGYGENEEVSSLKQNFITANDLFKIRNLEDTTDANMEICGFHKPSKTVERIEKTENSFKFKNRYSDCSFLGQQFDANSSIHQIKDSMFQKESFYKNKLFENQDVSESTMKEIVLKTSLKRMTTNEETGFNVKDSFNKSSFLLPQIENSQDSVMELNQTSNKNEINNDKTPVEQIVLWTDFEKNLLEPKRSKLDYNDNNNIVIEKEKNVNGTLKSNIDASITFLPNAESTTYLQEAKEKQQTQLNDKITDINNFHHSQKELKLNSKMNIENDIPNTDCSSNSFEVQTQIECEELSFKNAYTQHLKKYLPVLDNIDLLKTIVEGNLQLDILNLTDISNIEISIEENKNDESNLSGSTDLKEFLEENCSETPKSTKENSNEINDIRKELHQRKVLLEPKNNFALESKEKKEKDIFEELFPNYEKEKPQMPIVNQFNILKHTKYRPNPHRLLLHPKPENFTVRKPPEKPFNNNLIYPLPLPNNLQMPNLRNTESCKPFLNLYDYNNIHYDIKNTVPKNMFENKIFSNFNYQTNYQNNFNNFGIEGFEYYNVQPKIENDLSSEESPNLIDNQQFFEYGNTNTVQFPISNIGFNAQSDNKNADCNNAYMLRNNNQQFKTEDQKLFDSNALDLLNLSQFNNLENKVEFNSEQKKLFINYSELNNLQDHHQNWIDSIIKQETIENYLQFSQNIPSNL